MDRCRYPSKPCLNARAVKLNGELHRFCEQHRRQANQNQMRWSKRKQTVLRVRRSDGGDDDGDGDDDQGQGPPDVPPHHTDATNNHHPQNSYQTAPRHGLHLPGAPPPPHLSSSTQGPPVGMAPPGLISHHNVNAAGASLSHLSLNNHGMGHPHSQGPPNGGLISSFQDHMARGSAIPGANGVNLVLNSGAGRRELAPAPPGSASHRGGGGPHVPPIQTSLPPLLPPRAAADQPDPSAVHALLMLERAANVVSSHENPSNDDDEELQVRRELKRAKSNEWIARPTLSPAGLPTVASLVTHGTSSTTATASSSSSSASAMETASVIASVASIGRSASWQPPVVREDPRESLGAWMQRKQASLPSLSNITRIEKRPYDNISSSAPTGSSGNSFLHRGPENSSRNNAAPPHHGSTPYHVPLHHPVSSTKSSTTASSNSIKSESTADSAKRSALV